MKCILESNKPGPLGFLNSLVSDGAEAVGTVSDIFAPKRSINTKRVGGKYKQGVGPYLNGSISNYANELTMTFPMLIDDSLPPEVCSMISRANERYICTMLQILFSSAQFNGSDGKEIIQSIYGSLKPNMTFSDYIDSLDQYIDNMSESVDYDTDPVIKESVRMMVKELQNKGYEFPVNSLSEHSIADYIVMQDIKGDTVVREDFNRDKHGFIVNDPFTPDNPAANMSSDKPLGAADFSKLDSKFIDRYNDVLYKGKQLDSSTKRFENDEKKADYTQSRDEYRDEFDVLQKRLLDSDVKKSNELEPTLLIVQYNELDPNNSNRIYGRRTFVAGVKSRLIATDPGDIIDRIVVKNKTKINFKNLIRATTGEIKFFKDFIFSIDQAKIDAKNSIKKDEAAQVWKALEYMSSRNILSKLRKNKSNDASAITTLVVNKETANLLKKEYKINIEQPKTAKELLDVYNLLGLFIVDESLEVVKVLYRGNVMFEQQAFNYLEKESNDKSYKKVINLLGQANR
jgi:hypothetical protein